MTEPITLLWLRRDLRLIDHAALYHALKTGNPVQPVFVFDTDILHHFPEKHDRRLSFIASALADIDEQLKKRGGGLLVLHGSAQALIPKLASAFHASHIVAAEDYEPGTITRDQSVAEASNAKTTFVKDQLIMGPTEVTRQGEPYKVFTPYYRAWKANLTEIATAPYTYDDKGRYANAGATHALATKAGLPVVDTSSAENMLAMTGYQFRPDALWPTQHVQARLEAFMSHHAQDYPRGRDMLAEHGTSRISPYLRFGLISIRACAAAAVEVNAEVWLKELVWREFYAMILYHFPESVTKEWNPKYRALDWSYDKHRFQAWQEGKTGYPVVDAAQRQLLDEGWMHNRARMITASFLTKHLRIDWRLGEAHFGQYLMDYDLASNVGGWQWAASTGTDAQPYFRVFNPILQSRKFDPDGDYIRKYVPELAKVKSKHIHAPWEDAALPYHAPIVDHADARAEAISMFKSARA